MSSFKEFQQEYKDTNRIVNVLSTYYNGTRFEYKRGIIKTEKSKIFYDFNTFERPFDFLKYYMIVSYSLCRKYKINKHVLELMLYLYGEPPMTRVEFREVIKLLPYRTYNVTKLVESGWFRETTPMEEFEAAPTLFYGLSRKGLEVIESFYRRLIKISSPVERNDKNPVFWIKPKSLLDPEYRKALIKMKENENDGFSEYLINNNLTQKK